MPKNKKIAIFLIFLLKNLHSSKKGRNFASHLRNEPYRGSQKIKIMH